MANSPWNFLTALDGERESDRHLLDLTRKKELEIVTNMIAGSKVSLLYAFSGNGKTSLINAGIVPFFYEEGYAVFQTRPRPPACLNDPAAAFKACVLRAQKLPPLPSEDLETLQEARRALETLPPQSAGEAEFPVEALRSVVDRLEKQVRPLQGETLQARFREHMAPHCDRPLKDYLLAAQEFLGPATRMLVICDQFEELFVHFSNTAKLRTFVAQLGEAWKERALNIQFLFSMREDWVGSMIEFRDAMPDIFSKYYKLNPIGKTPAEQVLLAPLSNAGISPGRDAITRILGDLATSYSKAQLDRFSTVHLTESREDDPFLELPALQVVAEKMWSTRQSQKEPFSRAHYDSLRSIRPAASNGDSPADIVLDDYWLGFLNLAADPTDMPSEYWRELRIDLLYLLTDTRAHRRALSGGELIGELNAGPRRELGLPEVTPARLEAALSSLIDNRIVSRTEVPGGERQYELAHDFVVRSACKVWRALDRRRTGDLALLAKERERAASKLRDLSGLERRILRLMETAPAVLVIVLAWFTLGLAGSSPEKLRGIGGTWGWISVASGAGFAVIAGLIKEKTGVALGAAVALFGYIFFSVVQANVSSFRLENEQLVWIAAFGLIGILLLLWPRMVAKISGRLKEPTLGRIGAILSNEVADGLVLMIAPSLVMVADAWRPLPEWVGTIGMPLFWGATPLWALLTALLLRRGLGLGLIGTPWRIVRKNGSPAGFWRCLARQILFLVYLAANLGLSAYLTDSPWVFPLLWPTLGPLVVGLSRLHRNWYDIVTGFVFTDQPAGMPAPRTGSGDAAQAGAAAA